MFSSGTALAPGRTAQDVSAKDYSLLSLWHLLSLDAPCVAALWTVFFSRLFHVALPLTAPLALAVAVWMLYAADRIADAAAGKASEERHRFHQRHSTCFAVVWLACAPVLLVLVMHLPHGLRDGWLLLAMPMAAYVGAVHALQLRHVPKEPLIAVFFGVAAAMPVISSGLTVTLAPAVALFALLCWFNCAAIAAWEAPWSGYRDPFTCWLGQHFASSAATAVLLSLCYAVQAGPARWVGAGVAVGLSFLLILNQLYQRLSRTHVRALADAALLAPLFMLPLLALHRP